MRRKKMLYGLLSASLAVTAVVGLQLQPSKADQLPWMNTSLSPQTRAQLLVSAMTLDQKIEQLHGHGPDGPRRAQLRIPW
jgi:beta-glucosidase